MNHKRIIITAPVLAIAALAFTSAESNAKVLPFPDPAAVAPQDPGAPNYPTYDPADAVPTQPTSTDSTIVTDDTTAEAFQAGASGLGGAAIALTPAMWLYRRRQTHTA